MKKLGWFAVSAAVATMIVFGVLLLVANLYVQSQGAQQLIRQTLSDALHVPVSLKKTTLTPWEGLRIDGITLQPPSASDPGAPEADPLLTADSFRLQTSWWSLLRHQRIDIDAVLLDSPRLVWAQNREGRWVWPQGPSSAHHGKASHPANIESAPAILAAAASATDASAEAVPPAATPTTDAARGEDTSPAQPEKRAPDTFSVRKFRVRHGTLDLLNERRRLLGRLEEVDLDGHVRDAGHASGQVHVQRAAHARSGLRLTDFHSKFVYDATEGLSLDHGRGELAGGKLHANYQVRTQETGSPFSAECQIENVDLSRLIEEAGSQLKLIEGRLQGGVSLQGMSDDPARRHATGHLKLVGAQVRNFPVLQLLGDILHIEDLSHLQFKQAELDCRADADDLQIAALTLASNNLHILARGRYAAREDKLSLHGRLTIDQAISHQLPQFIEMNFTPCGAEAPGSRYIDFDVDGPLNKPTTNLFDRVLAGPTNGLLQNLLAPKPKKARARAAKAGGRAAPSATP